MGREKIGQDSQWHFLFKEHGIETKLATAQVKLAKTNTTHTFSSKYLTNPLSSQYFPNSPASQTHSGILSTFPSQQPF